MPENPSANAGDAIDFETRLAAKNRFDGNLRFGAKEFHDRTGRTGPQGPSSGTLNAEQARLITDLGRDRYARREELWEAVETCPVCGSADRVPFLSRMGMEIKRCNGCSHCYADPRVRFDVACELYTTERTTSRIFTSTLQMELDQEKFQYGLDLIAQYGRTPRDKILDIGCGSGVFLKVAERNGWARCVGVDINERYQSVYDKDARGIQYINASLESLDGNVLSDGYNAITMWNTLEHLYDLHGILRRLHGLLAPGGVIQVMVPNVRSLATRLMRERSPTFFWQHLSHFSQHSLRQLMEGHGFTTLLVETAISEIDNIKSYMSGEYPYYGYGDPEGLFEFITPEYLHRNMLGSRLIGLFRKG